MNNLKKIAALLMAMVMVLAMSSLAMAEGDTFADGIMGNTDGVWDDPDTPVPQGNSVILTKEITAYNPEESTININAPTITYSYKIEAGSAGKEITDATDNHESEASATATTKAGVGTPAIAVSLDGTTFTNGDDLEITPELQMSANANGSANAYKIKFTFNTTAFTGAGVYRYEITETTEDYGKSGVVDGDENDTGVRYLDVYVKDATDGAYEIYGYVCFKSDNSIDGTSTESVTAAGKTDRFTADNYYTYNLTIGKTLVNDQAMNTNQFPFKVTFANDTVDNNVLPIVSGSEGGTYTLPTLVAGKIKEFVIDGTSQTGTEQLKIASGSTVTFTGIPAGTTATIDEYNNVTGTIYTTTATGATENVTTAVVVADGTWASSDATNWTGVTAVTAEANKNAKATENFTVTFTNTLLQISPTGYVARIAPYALMLAAGVALLVIFLKRRKPVTEDDE